MGSDVNELYGSNISEQVKGNDVVIALNGWMPGKFGYLRCMALALILFIKWVNLSVLPFPPPWIVIRTWLVLHWMHELTHCFSCAYGLYFWSAARKGQISA